jgi:putative ABC transport system permease protein
MAIVFRIILESIRQAAQQLFGNKLRSFLSLLGITIGIFCVIAVMAAVDSLEYSIKDSFKQLGEDVIYLDRVDWAKPPSDEEFERIMKRPNPSYDDFKAIQTKVPTASLSCFSTFFFTNLVEWGANNVQGVIAIAVTEDYAEMFNMKFGSGRFFNPSENRLGTPSVVLGYKIAEMLFGPIDPIGKEVKILGRKVKVVGVIEKTGDSLFTPLPFDECIILPYTYAAKITDIKNNKTKRGLLNVKPAAGISMDHLKDDIVGVVRSERKLRPLDESNFALNTLSIINDALSKVFGSISAASWLIGGFAMLVGMFSVANIMFVSVKERTNLIGVKKAIGAKSYMVLMEFVIEAIILCLLGGLLGLLLVYVASKAATAIFGYEIFLSTKNMVIGLSVSALTGVLAGIIPALQAARMDPVEAMRS